MRYKQGGGGDFTCNPCMFGLGVTDKKTLGRENIEKKNQEETKRMLACVSNQISNPSGPSVIASWIVERNKVRQNTNIHSHYTYLYNYTQNKYKYKRVYIPHMFLSISKCEIAVKYHKTLYANQTIYFSSSFQLLYIYKHIYSSIDYYSTKLHNIKIMNLNL